MNVFELPLSQQVAPFCHELDLELVGLVGKIFVVEQLLLLVVEQHSNRASMKSLAEVEVTCKLFVQHFSSFQSNNFWNTISWKCFLKDDRIRSSLIQCQSFLNRKIDVDPIYRVLMSLPCIVQVLCTTWYIQVNLVKILVTFVPRVKRQEEYCLSLARILSSRYQSWICDRMKIERTSNMANNLEQFARNHNIVLQWRINQIASWMSLKSSEINDYSWIISTVQESPFCSSCCCETCFPSTVRPMNRLCEWILKIFLHSPEMNLSIFFSMYFLWVTQKMNHFLRNLVLGERVSLVQYRSNSFSPWERFLMKSQQVVFFVVLLLPLIWSAYKIFRIQLQRMFFELIFRNFCVVVVQIHQKLIWSMRNSDPRVSIVSTQGHNSDLNFIFTVQVTGCNFQHGSNFGVPLDPSFRLWCWIFSRKGVFTTSHCIELC